MCSYGVDAAEFSKESEGWKGVVHRYGNGDIESVPEEGDCEGEGEGEEVNWGAFINGDQNLLV